MWRDPDGGPYWSRWIVSASIRRGRGFPSEGARPRGQESSCEVNGADMSESSGSLVMSGNQSAGQGFVWFDALFTAGISSIKHYFAVFGKSPSGMDIFVARFAY